MKNLYVDALNALAAHLEHAINSPEDLEAQKKEFMTKTKTELVSLIMDLKKTRVVTVESVAKSILEDPTCNYLTYNEIAEAMAERLGSSTSHKSIASYVSKKKDWNVVPRRTTSERNTELAKLATQQ
jgi:hypothetical protein